MSALQQVVLEVEDPAATESFLDQAFGLGDVVGVRPTRDATDGFRGFTLSLVVAQPSTVDALVSTALESGATELKPVKKSFWGYGGVVQAPDGTIWKVASSSKKDKGPATREIDEVVLLLGCDDVRASKHFYADHGLAIGKSFGNKYVELDTPGSRVKLALYPRHAAAKDAGVPEQGSGSHRVVVRGDAGDFTDPSGFVWEALAT